MIRFTKKKKSKRPALIFFALGFIGLIGNQALASMTDGRAVERYTLDRISGKDALIQQHKQEMKVSQELIQQIEAERYHLFEEKVSRGEMDRLQELNKQKVINAISNNLGGVFVGKARYIYAISKGNEVNPMLLASIMRWETGNGTSDVCKNANNPAGLNWYKDCGYAKYGWYQKFPTLEKGIEKMAILIKDNYIDCGLTDISKIGRKYAPTSDKRNGMYGMDNNKWVPKVTEIYNKILKEAE